MKTLYNRNGYEKENVKTESTLKQFEQGENNEIRQEWQKQQRDYFGYR